MVILLFASYEVTLNVKMSPRSVCVFDDMYISATIRGSKCVTLKLAGQAELNPLGNKIVRR